jgi:rRNA-processing protein EBP2
MTTWVVSSHCELSFHLSLTLFALAPTITDWSSLCSYKQALHGAKAARALAAKHSLPFTRPDDFFAEMVKTDAHMERIRQRLLDESAGIAKSEARRREREGKKIGKQVQLEKLKERERSKKDMEERLKGLKRSASSLS